VIIQHTSTGAALGISKVMPFVFAAILGSWTGLYGAQEQRKGERLAAAEAEASAPAGG
jgi:hypothetical protein